jgi:hypothetical protein
MAKVKVEARRDYLDRLISTPRQGLLELIWNALDADAAVVHLDVEDTAMGAAIGVTVKDNGLGINADRAELEFGSLGGSWKLGERATKGGRALHGKQGRGRFHSFGIGEVVVWTSVSDSTEGRTRTVVRGTRQNPDEFDVETESVGNDEPLGTVVQIAELNGSTLNYIESDRLVDNLTAALAVYISKYHPKIIWREKTLDPSQLIEQQADITVEFDFGGEHHTFPVTIIEWSGNVDRALYLCNADGVALDEIPPGIQAPGFKFTGYAKWDGFIGITQDALLPEGTDELVPVAIRAVKDALREHFKSRSDERYARLLKKWKDEDSYPYSGEETEPSRMASRDLFDIVAFQASPAMEKIDPTARKLSLRLLKEAVETRPDSIQSVVGEILALSSEEVEEFRQLIEKTSLTDVIAASRKISDRLDFLVSLETMINEPDLKKVVKERSQLHRILAGETWVFREEYALVGDDHTLRTVLKTHRDILGEVALTDEDVQDDLVDDDGKAGVIDLMLSKVIAQPHERKEHVVIELKRPSVHVGKNQLQQIEEYAFAVANDSRFSGLNDSFEFWIIGDQLDDYAQFKATQENQEPGVTVKSAKPDITVRAITWAQVIRDARHRLHFVQQALNYDPDSEAGMAYLRARHARYIPESIAASAADETPLDVGASPDAA